MSAYDNPKMRDEIWIRVYAEHFHAVSPTHNPSTAAKLAAQVADDAVAFLPKPMHHEDADGFKATAFRSFKLHALHDLGPVKAGQPVLVVAGPSEGRVFPAADAWRHFCETHVFFLPICLDQPTDVGEDATTDAEVRP